MMCSAALVLHRWATSPPEADDTTPGTTGSSQTAVRRSQLRPRGRQAQCSRQWSHAGTAWAICA